jgi:hypothetical protein
MEQSSVNRSDCHAEADGDRMPAVPHDDDNPRVIERYTRPELGAIWSDEARI